MDLSQANTEAYLWFHRFHEAFNRSIKMAAIGLCLVDDALGKGMPRDELKQLAYNSGGLWGGMPDWTDPTGLVVEARADLGEAGILRTFSALDRFVDDLDADLEGLGGVPQCA
ncbi:MAG: hypothetical protein IT379_38620 [Deltaproteobacteria bacterium]|nr:hypothetical protein [Deltaproteobacteria bacterium]